MTQWNSKSKGVDDDEPQTCYCKTDCVERPIRRYFKKHGQYVAKHPYPFFIIPLLLSACLGFGLRYFELETDTEYLVTPKNGPAKAEREVVRRHFKMDQAEHFLPERAAVLDGFLDVMIADADGGHVLTSRHMQAVHKLNQFINSVTAMDDIGLNYTFASICAR